MRQPVAHALWGPSRPETEPTPPPVWEGGNDNYKVSEGVVETLEKRLPGLAVNYSEGGNRSAFRKDARR